MQRHSCVNQPACVLLTQEHHAWLLTFMFQDTDLAAVPVQFCPFCGTPLGDNQAHADIQAGHVFWFDDVEQMIASLKKPLPDQT